MAKSKIVEEEEGSVLYLIKRDKDRLKDEVLSMCKLKTLEYRIFRKIREKLRHFYKDNKKTKTPETVIKAFDKEMKELMVGNELP